MHPPIPRGPYRGPHDSGYAADLAGCRPTRTRMQAEIAGKELLVEEVSPIKRPNTPLSELTGGRVDRLLIVVDRWIDDIRAHAAEPETDNGVLGGVRHRLDGQAPVALTRQRFTE